MRYFLSMLISLVIQSSATAATIRLIIIADTRDISIGSGVQGNANNIRYFFKDVVNQGGHTLIETAIDNDSFNCGNINAVVDKVPDQQQDVIVFYYAGHGYREPDDKSKFPSFYCGSEMFDGGKSSLWSVTEKLKTKGARLVISIADTCNVLITEPPGPTAALLGIAPIKLKSDAYRNLFNNYRGVIVISSSIPGEFSWYYPDRGLFTQQLLRSFDNHTKAPKKGLWEELLLDATVEISVPTGNIFAPVIVKQTPQVDTSLLSKLN